MDHDLIRLQRCVAAMQVLLLEIHDASIDMRQAIATLDKIVAEIASIREALKRG